LGALFRRLIDISFYDHNIPEDWRRAAAQLANAVRADLEKGENNPEQLAAIRAACDKTMANARALGYGSLPWLLDEHKVPASDTIAFMLKPEHGHLLSDALAQMQPEKLAEIRPALVNELLRTRGIPGEEASSTLHRLAIMRDASTEAIFTIEELATFRDLDQDIRKASSALARVGPVESGKDTDRHTADADKQGTLLHNSFRGQNDDPISKGRFVTIHACLQPPLDVMFNIHSFGDNRELDEQQRKEWSRVNGVDAFVEFTLVGYVSHPEPFTARKMEVMVNPLSSMERFELGDHGLVGHGNFDGTRFLIHLYLSPAITDRLLVHVSALGRRTQPVTPILDLMQRKRDNLAGWQGEEHRLDLLDKLQGEITGGDPSFANLRFDLCDIRAGGHADVSAVSYFNVCRVYG
jgi:hypothetical protein